MLLHNQTKSFLRWTINMTTYTCDPWGSVDVPDMFVMHCKARGLPLDVSPVAPEIRADAKLNEAADAARADELFRANHEVQLAHAAEQAAKSELEKIKGELADATKLALETKVSLEEAKRKLSQATADGLAGEKLLAETAKKLAESEKTIERLEGALAEAKKPSGKR